MEKFNLGKMDIEKWAIPVGLLIFLYLILKNLNLLNSQSTATSPLCPRGNCYTRGFFQECDPNYLSRTWELICDCIDANPKCPGSPLVTDEGFIQDFGFAGLQQQVMPFGILKFT